MKQAEQIEHKGIVAFIGRDFVRVTITVNEACGGCAARKSCAMGQGEQREITIYTTSAAQYRIGEEVDIAARRTIGIMAVLLCYVAPLVVLIAALVIATLSGCSEGSTALIALGATALYFGTLALFHKHISRKVTFQITKK